MADARHDSLQNCNFWLYGIIRIMKREELFGHIKDTLVKEFECDESAIVPEARFFEDLDLDSIDAVDLVVRLRNKHDIEMNADDFKSIRTVGDLVDVLERITEGGAK